MFDFNLDEVEASTGGSVPKGTYLVQVEKSELAETKNGGQMIKIQFDIVGEQQNGRKLFEQYNIVNANPEAVKIGLGQIKTLVLASGASLSKFTSPEQLVGLECLVNVKQYEDEYGEQNSITSYKKLVATQPAVIHTAATTQQMVEQPGQATQAAQGAQGANGQPVF